MVFESLMLNKNYLDAVEGAVKEIYDSAPAPSFIGKLDKGNIKRAVHYNVFRYLGENEKPEFYADKFAIARSLLSDIYKVIIKNATEMQDLGKDKDDKNHSKCSCSSFIPINDSGNFLKSEYVACIEMSDFEENVVDMIHIYKIEHNPAVSDSSKICRFYDDTNELKEDGQAKRCTILDIMFSGEFGGKFKEIEFDEFFDNSYKMFVKHHNITEEEETDLNDVIKTYVPGLVKEFGYNYVDKSETNHDPGNMNMYV